MELNWRREEVGNSGENFKYSHPKYNEVIANQTDVQKMIQKYKNFGLDHENFDFKVSTGDFSNGDFSEVRPCLNQDLKRNSTSSFFEEKYEIKILTPESSEDRKKISEFVGKNWIKEYDFGAEAIRLGSLKNPEHLMCCDCEEGFLFSNNSIRKS